MRLYNQQDLENALNEALDVNDSAEAFVKKFVTNVGKILAKTPKTYRYFGPYWWSLKKLMIQHNIPGVDDFIDATLVEKTNLGTPELTCVAAWSFQEERISSMELPVNKVLLEDNDGNITEYVLNDEFMELRIAVG
ncbi:hypothetical protein [Methylocucumis oryzae]|uniref:Uncharacterized protein n=1 Tax=Methylocucumis oryzae TaxID=1632867 RepID=A0A0F3IMY4_9GAMM|nr:hypothetical protein [Methylocucumis oryzae]KJV08085.1 hypothetical protein VZ94_00565 [Methylocucumis oryzae]